MLLPKRHPRFRWIVLVYGAGLLLWLSLEDSSVVPVVLVSAGFTLLLAYAAITGRVGGQVVPAWALWIGAAVLGAGIGMGTALSAALLMLFKTGMHAHPIPDYPPGLMLDVLARAPIWALAGALAVVALLLLITTRRPP